MRYTECCEKFSHWYREWKCSVNNIDDIAIIVNKDIIMTEIRVIDRESVTETACTCI